MHGRAMKQEQDVAAGPDFLCIGMGKSGTGWLYDQCSHHPEFWMPPIKEMHYLDREQPRMITAQTLLDNLVTRHKRDGGGTWKVQDYKELKFLREAIAARRKRMSLEFYAAMFRFKTGRVSGDISPSYCTMPEDLIAQVMERFPDIKVILMMRDPVARAWSHFAMKARGKKVDTEKLRDPKQFTRLFEGSKAARKGSPASITLKWLRHVPPKQYRHFFFDDLQSDAARLRHDILGFLGADPALGDLDPGHNRKADKPKIDITPEIEAVLAEQFAEELRACAAIFGGHAIGWAKKHGA
jgi:Sulfotransferase family